MVQRIMLNETSYHGSGAIAEIPNEIAARGFKKAFVASDPDLVKFGITAKVTDLLDAAQVPYEVYSDIKPNPTIENVQHGVEAFKASGADCIVAIGGGSSMDTSKAIGIIIANPEFEDVRSLEGVAPTKNPCTPIIAVPTTAGTGSEVTASAVITDTERNYKLSVFSYEILPKYAVLDPELIMTAPASIAASCGVDALIHAMEAYVSRNATPFSDAMAEKAMELIGGNLRRFVANRQDEEAACAMMLGSNFAGISFAWARLGNVHAMSHPVSAYFNVPHGVANSILLPNVVEYNALADHGRYEVIYNYIREGNGPIENFTPDMLVEELRHLNEQLGIPATLSEVGVTADKIPAMAEDAMKSGNIPANPRQSTVKDIIKLYEKTM